MSTFDEYWMRNVPEGCSYEYRQVRDIARHAFIAGHAIGYTKRREVTAINKSLLEESVADIADYENDRLDSQERDYDRRGRL